jgi:hypothetical protein
VNKIIAAGGLVASLQDPVGLYIQTPDFSGYSLPPDPKLPADADVAECWHVIRGKKKQAGDNIDFILHARFEIPKRWKDAGVAFTVGDIQINGNPIQFGAQITQTFQVALRGLAVKTTLPPEKLQPCRADNPKKIPAPLEVQDLNLFTAGSTSTAVTLVEQGTTVKNVAIFAFNTNKKTTVAFTGGAGVKVKVTDFEDIPGQGQLFTAELTIDKKAPLGDRALQLTNSDGAHGPAAPGLLSIVAPGTLGKQAAPAFAAALPSPAAAAGPTQEAIKNAMMGWLQKKR